MILMLGLTFGKQTLAGGPQLPLPNPYLADSVNPLGHTTSAQQTAQNVPGPESMKGRLAEGDIDYVHLGQIHFGGFISGAYPDGRRVIWSNGIGGVVKIDHDSFRVIDRYAFPEGIHSTAEQAEEEIAYYNEADVSISSVLHSVLQARVLANISGAYPLVDSGNEYYLATSHSVEVYGDAEKDNPDSAIEQKRVFERPSEVTGNFVGINMTYDGWLTVATEHGFLLLIKRDFSDHRVIRLKHSGEAEEAATAHAGMGWIRNGFALDEAGGIYIASQEHIHKVVWDGERLSTDEADGAWTARYRNGRGTGTGTTPSLMGFGDEDRFVVITDGDKVMNMTLFWREEIPADWQTLPGAPSRRIAGMAPANMDDPELELIQSEQSAVIGGYGALICNSMPRKIPWWLPDRVAMVIPMYLGGKQAVQPYGIQKFEWNPQSRQLQSAWVNKDVSCPNAVPMLSTASNIVYIAGARNGEWTLEALDWETGQLRFYSVVGDERYNSFFTPLILDQSGLVIWGTRWGRVRLNPSPGQ